MKKLIFFVCMTFTLQTFANECRTNPEYFTSANEVEIYKASLVESYLTERQTLIERYRYLEAVLRDRRTKLSDSAIYYIKAELNEIPNKLEAARKKSALDVACDNLLLKF